MRSLLFLLTLSLAAAVPLQAEVTASLNANAAAFGGPCPVTVRFDGTISSDAAASVTYRFVRSDGGTAQPVTIDFKEPGTRNVSTSWMLGAPGFSFKGSMQIEILAPNRFLSPQEPATFTVDCGTATPVVRPAAPPTREQPAAGKAGVQTRAIEKPTALPAPGGKGGVAAPVMPRGVATVPQATVNPDALLAAISNWDFSNGLLGWTATGTAFNNQPTVGDNVVASRVGFGNIGGDYWNLPYPIGNKALAWIGTYENHPDDSTPLGTTQGDAPQGTLTSRAFVIRQPFLSFLVGGGRDPQRESIRLQIQENGNWVDTPLVATGANSEILSRNVWDVRPMSGKNARIVISDLSSDGWGHINAADFQFLATDPSPSLVRIPVAAGVMLPADPDAPLFGFADLHTHPAANVGFGGNLYAGTPVGPIDQALASCAPHHDTDPNDEWFGPATGAGPTIENVFKGIGLLATALMTMSADVAKPMVYGVDGPLHSGVGYPALMTYRYYNALHQHMYVDWIRRAYDGGLRLIVAHPVHASLLANIDPKASPALLDDKTSGDRQLEVIKDLVNRNSSWMEIAYTPQQARSIIRRNKLCVVLGLEVDAIGNFTAAHPPTAAQMNAEIERLYNEGVRHIFPIHLTDSAIGGMAIYSDLFNLNNIFLNERSVDVKAGPTQFSLGIATVPPTPLSIHFNNGRSWTTATIHDALEPSRQHIQEVKGQVNTAGLTELGRSAITKMMGLGMIIDVDHMSDESIGRTLDMAEGRSRGGVRGYPVVSGHSDFRELGHRWGDMVPTSALAHEAQKTREVADRIIRLGGMFAPITDQTDRTQAEGSPVASDAPGTSKSYAQNFHYAVSVSRGQGVGIGTDMAMLGGMGPRFGTDAAPLDVLPEGLGAAIAGPGGRSVDVDDDMRRAKLDERRRNVSSQVNGVRYDAPISDYRRYRFFWTYGNTDWPIYTEKQRDFWEALAIWSSGTRPEDAEQPGVTRNRSMNTRNVVVAFAEGLTTDDAASLVRPVLGVGNGEYFAERRAAFLLRHPDQGGRGPGSVGGSEEENVTRIKNEIQTVWNAWNNMTGDNPPLHKLVYRGTVNGRAYTRDFDFNIDGLAHYGMVPDMLQDLKNIGLGRSELGSLFNSAETYIRAWEKAWSLRD